MALQSAVAIVALRLVEGWSDDLQSDTGEQRAGSEDDPMVFVRGELFDGGLITAVFHEWDGSWQYLTPDGYERDKTDLVHQSHVFAADPSLRELAEMPPGMWAGRSHPGNHWKFEVLEAEDD